MRRKWFLILPMVVLLVSCLDLGATLHFSKTDQDFKEANPIARYVWDNHNDIGLIIFKLAVTFSSCFCIGLILAHKGRSLQIAASVFGLMVCSLLIGWWFLWIFS